jgi:hypothetical protein
MQFSSIMQESDKTEPRDNHWRQKSACRRLASRSDHWYREHGFQACRDIRAMMRKMMKYAGRDVGLPPRLPHKQVQYVRDAAAAREVFARRASSTNLVGLKSQSGVVKPCGKDDIGGDTWRTVSGQSCGTPLRWRHS